MSNDTKKVNKSLDAMENVMVPDAVPPHRTLAANVNEGRPQSSMAFTVDGLSEFPGNAGYRLARQRRELPVNIPVG